MKRVVTYLDDAVAAKVEDHAARERRSVSKTAALLIEAGLDKTAGSATTPPVPGRTTTKKGKAAR